MSEAIEIRSEFELCNFLVGHDREIRQAFRSRYSETDTGDGRTTNFQRARIEAIREIAKSHNVSFTDQLLRKTIRK